MSNVLTTTCTGRRDAPHDPVTVDLTLNNGARATFDCPTCHYDVLITAAELAWLDENLEHPVIDLHHLAVTLHLFRHQATA